MDDGSFVTRSALGALDAALERHLDDRRRAWDTREDAELAAAFGSLVECTFWVATLDEWLYTTHGAGYTAARDSHEYGGDVLAMLWARDRHYHQLPFSTERDERGFFDHGIPGALFYITPGLVWRSAEALEERGSQSRREWRAAYVERAEGQGTAQPVDRARGLFRHLAETTELFPDESERIEP